MTADAALEEVLDAVSIAVAKVESTPLEYRQTVAILSDLLFDALEAVAEAPVARAAERLAQLPPASNVRETARAIVEDLVDEVEALGRDTLEDLSDDVARALAATFVLGQSEVRNAAGWVGEFAFADLDAIASLRDSGLYWIGEHYGKAIPIESMLDEVEEVLLREGLGRAEAGRRFVERFGHLYGRSEAYFVGFASTIATRSRSFGAVSSMVEIGGTEYEYLNPDDERTSDVCRCINGQTFRIVGAVRLRESLRTAEDPEAWKAIAPWPKLDDVADYSRPPKPDGTPEPLPGHVLQARGIAWPPLHFYCRSSIDVRAFRVIRRSDLDPSGYLPGLDPEPLAA